MMGEAKRRKTLDPTFGEVRTPKLHPNYHFGIEGAIAILLKGVHPVEAYHFGPETIMLTNDVPGHPDEVSMGFTAAQIEELRDWVSQNQHLIPQNLKISILPIENCVHGGRIWKDKNFTKLLIRL
jgi:hypothetical protein